MLDVSQTLHGDRGRLDHQKRVIIFRYTHSFSYRGDNADFWPLTH